MFPTVQVPFIFHSIQYPFFAFDLVLVSFSSLFKFHWFFFIIHFNIQFFIEFDFNSSFLHSIQRANLFSILVLFENFLWGFYNNACASFFQQLQLWRVGSFRIFANNAWFERTLPGYRWQDREEWLGNWSEKIWWVFALLMHMCFDWNKRFPKLMSHGMFLFSDGRILGAWSHQRIFAFRRDGCPGWLQGDSCCC